MTLAVSLGQAAANALTVWLRARLSDVHVEPRWPEPHTKLPPKAITVLLAGPPAEELLEPVVVGRRDLPGGRAAYLWSVRISKQPMQLDVWAKSDLARDDLVARITRAVNASEADSIGAKRADPIRNGVLLRLGDGWDGFADFLFDGAGVNDTPDSVQRCEFRATARGHAWMNLTTVAESVRLARVAIEQRLHS
jgi:hypothetical protein